MSLDETSIFSQRSITAPNSSSEQIYEFEDFRLDAAHLMLYRNGETIALKPKVIETLVALVERRGELVSKDELMKRLWADSFVEESNLTQNIYLLRQTLGETQTGQPFIETFRRRGYRFNGAIKTKSETTPTVEENYSSETDAVGAEATNAQTQIAPQTSSAKNRILFFATSAILLIAAISVGFWLFNSPQSNGAAPIESIAVMPFVNESNNADVEYLSDGMTETLINNLSQIPRLKVMSRNAVFRYKGKQADAQKIGGELNVRAVLNGSVKQISDNLVINVSLDDARDNRRLWGEQYVRKFADIIAVQREIVRDVSAKLSLKLSGAEQQQITKRSTTNPEAYRLYLQGRYFWNKRTHRNVRKSIEYFNKAVALDPDYALAYTGIADAYWILGAGYYGVLLTKDLLPKTKEAALRALEIDNTLAEAHVSLASIKERWEWDFAAAERGYKRAIELSPDYALAHHRYGTFLVYMGRFDEGLAELERARDIEPLSLVIAADLSFPFYHSGRYERAVEILQKVLEVEPNLAGAHARLAHNYTAMGKYEEAVAHTQKAFELSGQQFREDGSRRANPLLATVYAAAGRRGEALQILDKMRADEAQDEYVYTFNRAVVYAQLGDKDEAFKWLERAFDERSGGMMQIKVIPQFDIIRDDPRFQDLIRRVGLPQ